MPPRFEWDEEKDRINRAKHGLSFTEASAIFDGPVLSARDDRVDYGEERFISIGRIVTLVVVVVAHTYRYGTIRLISARKATRREGKKYYEHLEQTA